MKTLSFLNTKMPADIALSYSMLHNSDVFCNTLPEEEFTIDGNPDWPYPWVKMVKIRFNLHGYRSDPFTKLHTGKHIVFSGCSQTFGFGLELDETWSKILYNKISSLEKTSGYFNLGVLMGNMKSILINFIQYINEFGKPDVLFINMPTIFRYYAYDQNEKTYAHAMINNYHLIDDEAFLKKLKLDFFQDYFLLNSFCKINNIALFSTSWDFMLNDSKSTNEVIEELKSFSPEVFDTFIPSIEKDVSEYCLEYLNKNPGDPYYLFARDNDHAGKAINEYWANLFFEKYQEQLK